MNIFLHRVINDLGEILGVLKIRRTGSSDGSRASESAGRKDPKEITLPSGNLLINGLGKKN